MMDSPSRRRRISTQRTFSSAGYDEPLSPLPTPSIHYDASGNMNRMRASMLGESQELRLAEVASSVGAGSEECDHPRRSLTSIVNEALRQIPAICLITIFHLMIGIPFGVSYFPIDWSTNFPLPGMEALGIRMFLFATVIGQVFYTLQSGFKGPVGLQMVENVPFCHALAQLVIKHQGYGIDAISSTFILFGISSVIVGIIFLVLGKFNLGRVVYYFPNHVLVGLIAGIGVYLAKTGVEVTVDTGFSLETVEKHWNLLSLVALFEVGLRILDRVLRDDTGSPTFALLSPIYFCSITPMFYLGLLLFQIDVQTARDGGYFFPSLSGDSGTSSPILDEHLFDMWTVIDFSTFQWAVIGDSIPTLISLTLFSLIHVPINIPALSLSTNTEVDMNTELIAHGYSNIVSGCFGGLQNYMAYTQSVVYFKSGGTGKISGFAVAFVTSLLFMIGPTVASFIPRCMAGTLLVHVGIDLFVEGVYDSYPKFDLIEYSSVILIIVVMTLFGMDAAMLMGVLTAVVAFLGQNLSYINPVRGCMTAATLRSDERNRPREARTILDDPRTGRIRIMVLQLQGHLFFGNMVALSKNVTELLAERQDALVVILDFSLVLGIDSSAAQALVRLKSTMRKEHGINLSIFVSGSASGFPTEFDLSRELTAKIESRHHQQSSKDEDETTPTETTGLRSRASSCETIDAMVYAGSHVAEDLNLALIYAENYLISCTDPTLVVDVVKADTRNHLNSNSTLADERDMAFRFLVNMCPSVFEQKHAERLFCTFRREVYLAGDELWKQGSSSTSMKLLVRGTLISMLENEADTQEYVSTGNLIGELGVIENLSRFSSLQCHSREAVVYSLSRDDYLELGRTYPHATRLLELICIRYLSARVQHVSNRVFETRCLPI